METLYNIEVEKLSSNKTTTGHHQINLHTVMATSRDPNRLKRVWLDWRNAIGSPIRSIYREYVDVLNFAANDNGKLTKCFKYSVLRLGKKFPNLDNISDTSMIARSNGKVGKTSILNKCKLHKIKRLIFSRVIQLH